MSSSGEALSFRIHARSPEVPGPWPTTKIESIAGRGEIVRKLDRSAVNSQVTAWAASFCKSVGVCLRRFESCTCHTAKRASDQRFCVRGPSVCTGEGYRFGPVCRVCARVSPHHV